MQDFQMLKVWQYSHRLNIDLYRLTKTFPKQELYGITSQVRRAASSVPTNIAEGCGRYTDKDQAHFFQISYGSAQELLYLLILVSDLGIVKESEAQLYRERTIEVKKMLVAILKRLRHRIAS